MPKGTVVAIYICPQSGDKMRDMKEVIAEAGQGLVGDRYHGGGGSWNRDKPGKRQVTLMNAMFFAGTEFGFGDSRRNIFTEGIELMDLIGKEFSIGDTAFRGVSYCDPCNRPNTLAGIRTSFRNTFFDRGGLIADVLSTGPIRVGDIVQSDAKKK